MQKNTPQAHLTAITRRVADYARYHDAVGLSQYLCSEGFVTSYARLPADHRKTAYRCITEAQLHCWPILNAKCPLPPPCSKRVDWKGNPDLVARLRRLAPLVPDNVDLGRQLGISATAAKLGRYRFANPKNTGAAATIGHATGMRRTLAGAQKFGSTLPGHRP